MNTPTPEQEIIVEVASALSELKAAFGPLDDCPGTPRQIAALEELEKLNVAICRYAVGAPNAPAILRAEFMVENPSAWETFDQGASDVIRDLIAAYRQEVADHRSDLAEFERQTRSPI